MAQWKTMVAAQNIVALRLKDEPLLITGMIIEIE